MIEPASVILVGDDGWTDTEPALLAERVTSAYGFHRPWWRGVSLFHRDGGRYEVVSAQPARALPPLSKLLERRLAHATSFDDVAEVLRYAATETDSA
jgi:hypothetical protein